MYVASFIRDRITFCWWSYKLCVRPCNKLDYCWIDFNENWYRPHAIAGYSKLVLYKCLQYIILTWWTLEVVRWEDHAPPWQYPCYSVTIDNAIICDSINQWSHEIFVLQFNRGLTNYLISHRETNNVIAPPAVYSSLLVINELFVLLSVTFEPNKMNLFSRGDVRRKSPVLKEVSYWTSRVVKCCISMDTCAYCVNVCVGLL